jgi:hypothetical protein
LLSALSRGVAPISRFGEGIAGGADFLLGNLKIANLSRQARCDDTYYYILVSPKSQYRYFLSLDKTVKLAAAFYLVILMGGTGVIWLGIGRLARDIQTGHPAAPLIFGGIMILAFAGFLYSMGRITWISDVHARLDGHFFRLLEQSDLILIQGLILALPAEERVQVYNLPPGRKEVLANGVFLGLAQSNSLFTHLLRTGIFRFWISYWISLYGTFVFIILTVESFSLVLRGVDPYAKVAFTISWALALLHLGLGVLLGRLLFRMTGDVAKLLVRLHRDEIATLLKDKLREEGEPME